MITKNRVENWRNGFRRLLMIELIFEISTFVFDMHYTIIKIIQA